MPKYFDAILHCVHSNEWDWLRKFISEHPDELLAFEARSKTSLFFKALESSMSLNEKLEIAKVYADAGLPVYQLRDKDSNTSLHCLAQLPNHPVVQYFELLYAFDNRLSTILNVKNAEGKTAFHIASIHKNFEFCKLILSMDTSSLTVRDNNGTSPLAHSYRDLSSMLPIPAHRGITPVLNALRSNPRSFFSRLPADVTTIIASMSRVEKKLALHVMQELAFDSKFVHYSMGFTTLHTISLSDDIRRLRKVVNGFHNNMDDALVDDMYDKVTHFLSTCNLQSVMTYQDLYKQLRLLFNLAAAQPADTDTMAMTHTPSTEGRYYE